MNTILKVIVGLVVILVAWQIIKGILGLLVGVAVAGLVIYGGVKLLEGGKR